MVVSVSDVVRWKYDENMVKTAKEYTLKKLKHTADTWQDRKQHTIKKILDIFKGDLAKELVKDILKRDGFEDFEDYDVWRVESGVDPNFERPGDWDLRICDRITVEIKSSIEKSTNDLEFILKNRRFTIYYGKAKCDINIQVFYIPINLDFGRRVEESQEIESKDVDSIIELFKRYVPEGYLMGWIKKEDLIRSPPIELTGRTSWERPRCYYDAKLYQGEPMEKLLHYIKELCGYEECE